jgi:hypothetical protein
MEDEHLRSVAISCSRQCLADSRELIRVIHNLHHRKMVNLLCYNAHCKLPSSLLSINLSSCRFLHSTLCARQS